MSKTYRKNPDGAVTGDGGRHYATPRYQPGSRRKPHRIVARPVRRDPPDLEALGRAVVKAALSEAAGAGQVPYQHPDGSGPSARPGGRSNELRGPDRA